MENKFDGSLAITDNSKKENPMSRIVVENFGDWSNFRKAIKDAWENIDYDPRENKFSQRRFTREILLSNASKIDSADLGKLSNLVIKEINVLEHHKEKIKTENKEKYAQREMPFSDKKE